MIIILLVIAAIGLYIYKSSIKDGDIENEESEQRGLLIKKTDLQERNESMLRMANNMGITIEEVKEDYITDLEKNNIGTDFKDQIIEDLDREKIHESRIFGIKAKNTGSALMREWFIEYISAKENQKIDDEFIDSEIQPQNNNQEIKKYVNQKRMHASFNDADLLYSFEKGSYEKGTLNQIVLEEILKERNLIPCSAHDRKKYGMRMRLEEMMENNVIEYCKNKTMTDPFSALIAVNEALDVFAEVYEKSISERKDEISLNEFEISTLIEEIRNKIFNKLIKH